MPRPIRIFPAPGPVAALARPPAAPAPAGHSSHNSPSPGRPGRRRLHRHTEQAGMAIECGPRGSRGISGSDGADKASQVRALGEDDRGASSGGIRGQLPARRCGEDEHVHVHVGRRYRICPVVSAGSRRRSLRGSSRRTPPASVGGPTAIRKGSTPTGIPQKVMRTTSAFPVARSAVALPVARRAGARHWCPGRKSPRRRSTADEDRRAYGAVVLSGRRLDRDRGCRGTTAAVRLGRPVTVVERGGRWSGLVLGTAAAPGLGWVTGAYREP